MYGIAWLLYWGGVQVDAAPREKSPPGRSRVPGRKVLCRMSDARGLLLYCGNRGHGCVWFFADASLNNTCGCGSVKTVAHDTHAGLHHRPQVRR